MNNKLEAAKILWDYCRLSRPLHSSDAILALGSYDCILVAHKAADLYHQGYSDKIIVSGGVAQDLQYREQRFQGSEANIMAKVLSERGVPEDAIIKEKDSTNTGENFSCSKNLAKNLNLRLNSLLVITVPYVERRVRATAQVHCPEEDICITSFDMGFNDYFAYKQSQNRENIFINALVGTINRLLDYPQKGFQSFEFVPENVLRAKRVLETLGYKGDYGLPTPHRKPHRRLMP